MKRILWFSNCELTTGNISSTGTWLIAMMEALVENEQIELYNVTDASVKEVTRRDCRGVKQWILPKVKTDQCGLPSTKIINIIRAIENEVNPDLIHIWGTENYWGMLAARGILNKPVLLDMQGVISAIIPTYYGGLTNIELFKSVGLKEIILPRMLLFFRKKKLEKKSHFEHFIIKNITNISIQSDWVGAYVEHINPYCNIYKTKILLRKDFYVAKPWSICKNSAPVLFTSSSGAAAYKGLHILFRALAVLKNKYPGIKLKIAGSLQKSLLYTDGYVKWLNKLATKLEIKESIEWLGNLNSAEIINQLYNTNVSVIPSFIESYSMTFAEASYLGVPIVASYAGAMSELANHNESALFFPIGDFIACAAQIDRIIKDDYLAERISINAREASLKRNDSDLVLNTQLDIYNKIACNENKR